MAGPDRKTALLAQSAVTGIDFVAVHADQVTLDVVLFHAPSAMAPALALTPADVTITGEDEPSIPVVSVAAVLAGGREVVRVVVARPGGYGRYWLALWGARIDPFFRQLQLDFKAACPRDIDCTPPAHVCPPEAPDDIRVDGTARDFWSLRRALLDFAGARHPRWQDRLEADVGVMAVELMAALGDELAYYQDRAGREAQFGSATQRRSVRRHVQLVDYQLDDGLGARGWLALDIDPASAGWQAVPAGSPVWARGDGDAAFGFEIGEGLDAALAGVTFRARAERNRLRAHLWDGDVPDAQAAYRPLPTTCLPVGATSVHVDGHHAAWFAAGERVFLVTEPPAAQRALPVRAHLVTLTAVADELDPLAAALGTSAEVTRLTWAEPTPFELDLAWLRVLGNAVPITAGVTHTSRFSIGDNTRAVPTAVERVGPDQSVAFLHSLPAGDSDLVRLGAPRASRPELAVFQVTPPTWTRTVRWHWRPQLLGSHSSQPQDAHFVLDDGTWAIATGAYRDYVSGSGTTVRFGDGEFGRQPPRGNPVAGQESCFEVVYRLGNGARGNLPAGALREPDPALAFLRAVTNPLPTTGGAEPETLAQAKRDAPQAFRAETHRAVRPEDFDAAAQRLPWVQRAGTRFRWTGSWSTAFTTIDAASASALTPAAQREARAHLERVRMAGRELHVRPPRYADLTLAITICLEASADRAAVEAATRVALAAFFHPDRFTFGTPLDRSELEAQVQRVPGVRAVKRVAIARRGHFPARPFLASLYQPGLDEVIRVAHDPRHPDRGSIAIHTEGAA